MLYHMWTWFYNIYFWIYFPIERYTFLSKVIVYPDRIRPPLTEIGHFWDVLKIICDIFKELSFHNLTSEINNCTAFYNEFDYFRVFDQKRKSF